MVKRYEDMAAANAEAHRVGEVWHVKVPFVSGLSWYVQFPAGRMAFKTKREAMSWAAAISQK